MAVAITSTPARTRRAPFAPSSPRPSQPAGRPRGPLHAVEAPIRRTVRKRELIYGRGDRADHMYVLESGRVKLYRLSPDGREVALALVEPGEPFGEEMAVGVAERTLYAEALESSRVRLIDRAQLRAWASNRPDVLMELTRNLWHRLDNVERQLESLVFRKVTHRLADLLLQWTDKYGEATPRGVRLQIRLTHQEMASLIGSSRETVTLTLGQLVDSGLIAYDPADRRSIVIPDVARLTRYANSD